MGKIKRSYCIFIDILGFKNEILSNAKKGTSEDHLKNLLEAIEKANKELDEDIIKWRKKVFSDNVFLTLPEENDTNDAETKVGFKILELMEYQMRMIEEGFFIRGGWTIGEVYVSEDILYGEGLIEAYTIESKAIFPLIELSESMVKEIKLQLGLYSDKKDSAHNETVLYDETNGKYFISYLNSDLLCYEGRLNSSMLQNHKNKVSVNLTKYKGNNKIYEKYLWVANYHNFICDEIRADSYKIQCSTKYKFKRLDKIVNTLKTSEIDEKSLCKSKFLIAAKKYVVRLIDILKKMLP